MVQEICKSEERKKRLLDLYSEEMTCKVLDFQALHLFIGKPNRVTYGKFQKF